ncbi:MAG: hypothetical protein WC760_01135 [Bacteroidia bacterium]|jgi:nucleoid DNA-binding protein/cell division protein FtsN
MNAGSHNDIWELVKSLLYDHDCVIIPSFGGFVCNREPARIDQISHVILPPGKRIIFNQNLRSNDGLLAGKLAETTTISYTQAIHRIEELVNQVVETLQDKKQISIDAFGSFRLNAEANYVFLPDRQNNYLASSYGLMPLQADSVSTGYTRMRKTRLFKERKPVTPASGRSRHFWPKTLVAVLTLMLMINGWIYFRENPTGNLHIGNASLNITSWFDSLFNKQEDTLTVHVENLQQAEEPVVSIVPETIEQPVLIPENPLSSDNTLTTDSVSESTVAITEPIASVEPIEEPYVYNLENFGKSIAAAKTSFYIPVVPESLLPPVVVEPALEAIVTDEPETNLIVPESTIAESGHYYIIGGVFCKKRNAEHFKAELTRKGYHAEVLINPAIQCQRVSYASFTSRSEAEQKLREIKSGENAEAWLLQTP